MFRFGLFVSTILLSCYFSDGNLINCGISTCDTNFYSQTCCCRLQYSTYEYCCSSDSEDCQESITTDSVPLWNSPDLSTHWGWSTRSSWDYHYDDRFDDSSDLEWWEWFLVCVGSVGFIILLVTISVCAAYRRSRIYQAQQYVVAAPLLQPPYGRQTDYPVNMTMYPPCGPPPGYFESEPVQPTSV
ncbi:uncharacterized protein LOC134192039 [Corticium candelabrum]|uniref:uncharacterized protein LOC134192039 n=1 Tax=Corticium candelabrum TaxID=121492 RepID=UPI002E26EA50|nr:uncharacterized protein LOC134192039 [Corticium candelabrum]